MATGAGSTSVRR